MGCGSYISFLKAFSNKNIGRRGKTSHIIPGSVIAINNSTLSIYKKRKRTEKVNDRTIADVTPYHQGAIDWLSSLILFAWSNFRNLSAETSNISEPDWSHSWGSTRKITVQSTYLFDVDKLLGETLAQICWLCTDIIKVSVWCFLNISVSMKCFPQNWLPGL